jgi:hypothetical protein
VGLGVAGHHGHQRVDPVDQKLVVLLPVGRARADVLQLLIDEIHAGEDQVADGVRIVLGRGILSNVEKKIFHSVGQLGDPDVGHHRGGTLDGVHDPEDLVDLIVRKTAFAFRG